MRAGERLDACVILNPAAGQGRSRRIWERLAPAVASCGISAVVRESARPGHAAELAEHAAREGFPLVVAAGGDGTIHEVVNGLMRAGQGARFAAIPAGTGNDFVRNLGLPPNRPDAVLPLLARKTFRRLDLGKVNGRYFVNMAGAGFNAEVARRASALPKYVPGTFNYIVGVFGALISYRPRRVEIEIDGQRWEREAFMVHIGNAPQCAGGMKLCPNARMDDGELDVLVLGPVGRFEALSVLPRTFQGAHVKHPKVEQFRGRTIAVRSAETLPLQADGELLGCTPARIETVAGALPVLVPEPVETAVGA